MKEELKIIFSNNLKRLLDENEKTQADLCRYIGVSSATASDWCNGKKIPRADKLQKICTWLRCSLSDLLNKQIKSKDAPEYYDSEVVQLVTDKLRTNPEYAVLFKASADVKPEDIEFVEQFIKKMS